MGISKGIRSEVDSLTPSEVGQHCTGDVVKHAQCRFVPYMVGFPNRVRLPPREGCGLLTYQSRFPIFHTFQNVVACRYMSSQHVFSMWFQPLSNHPFLLRGLQTSLEILKERVGYLQCICRITVTTGAYVTRL